MSKLKLEKSFSYNLRFISENKPVIALVAIALDIFIWRKKR